MRRFFLFVLLATPSLAFAHGDAPSLEAEVGGYLIDIGYDDLEAGTPVEFDADLYTNEPLAYADFATFEYRVTRDGQEIAAGAIDNDERVPTFDVTFPEPGGYDMDVRFLDDAGQLIVPRTFHLEIPGSGTVMLRNADDALHYVLAGGLFALSFGIAGYALWQKYGPKA